MTTRRLALDRPGKPYKGIPMEGIVAQWYARNAGRQTERRLLVEKIRADLPAGGEVLEVAPGPGHLAIDLARSGGYQVTGLDISKTFVEIAQANAREAGVAVDFRHGSASDMPFEDETFDFIICVAAFKNFSQPVEAVREMHRVLKPGGRACVADLRRDVPLVRINQHIYDDLHMRGIDALLTRLVFRTFLLKNAYTKIEIEDLVSQTGFTQARIVEDAIGMEIWLGK